MASIYFYYNELLQQSANQAVMSGRNGFIAGDDQQQQQATIAKRSQATTKAKMRKNQGDDGTSKAPFRMHADTEATLAALQPRMSRLAYLPAAGATNLDALARSLGPKL